MKKEDILALIQQEATRIAKEQIFQNAYSGSPIIPISQSNGNDNLQINSKNVIGFQPLPTVSRQHLVTETGKSEYGFSSIQNVGIAGGLSQAIENNKSAIYPIPYVLGHGVGIFSAFNGGYAPNGTITAFSNAGTSGQLWIRLEGKWYGVNLPLNA